MNREVKFNSPHYTLLIGMGFILALLTMAAIFYPSEPRRHQYLAIAGAAGAFIIATIICIKAKREKTEFVNSSEEKKVELRQEERPEDKITAQ